MANHNNPFAAFTESFKAFTDPNAANNLLKLFPVDVNAMVAAQRANAETVSALNKAVAEVTRLVLSSQAKSFQSAAADFTSLVQKMSNTTSPEACIAVQAEHVKTSVQKTISDVRDLTKAITEFNNEVFDLVSEGVTKNIGEVANVTHKKKAA